MLNTRNPYWLKEACVQADITIVELARRTGISRSQLSRLIPSEGRPSMLPQVRTLQKIEDALGMATPAEQSAAA